MKRSIILSALAIPLLLCSVARAIPLTIGFSGTIDTSRSHRNFLPGAPEIRAGNGLITGQLIYESDKITHDTYAGYNILISINNVYTYQATVSSITLSQGGMWDDLMVTSSLTSVAAYGLPATLDFRLHLEPKGGRFINGELPAVWDMDQFYATHSCETAGIILSNSYDNTYCSFDINNIYTTAPVPEPSSLFLFAVALLYMGYVTRRAKETESRNRAVSAFTGKL